MLRAGSLTSAMRPSQRLLVSGRQAARALILSPQHRSLRSSPVFAQQRRGDDEDSDKSWSEIARGAASVAGDALKKLVKPLTSLVKSPEPARAPPARQPEDDLAGAISGALSQRGGLLGGLVGGALGRVLGAGIGALAGTMQEAMRTSDALAAEAAEAVARDDRVLAALGGPVRCGPPSSVSSSTQIINGLKSSVTTLAFAAEGPTGRARVDVSERNGATDIRVSLGSGAVVRVQPGGPRGGGPRGGSSSGRVIDVDVQDYKVR